MAVTEVDVDSIIIKRVMGQKGEAVQMNPEAESKLDMVVVEE